MKTTMPSESLTAAVGSVVGSILVILGAYGAEVPAAVAGAIVTLVSWLAFGLTLLVRYRRAARKVDNPTG